MFDFCDELIFLGVTLQTTGVEKPRNGVRQLSCFYTMVSATNLHFNSHNELSCGDLNLFFEIQLVVSSSSILTSWLIIIGNCGYQAHFLLCCAVLKR